MGFYSGSDHHRQFERCLRRIARGAEFQCRFAAVGGDGLRLFGLTGGYELDDHQLALFQWGRWYESIYKMGHDRPDQKIIEDDEKLDAWYERFIREAAMRHGKRKSGDSSLNFTGKKEPATFKVFD